MFCACKNLTVGWRRNKISMSHSSSSQCPFQDIFIEQLNNTLLIVIYKFGQIGFNRTFNIAINYKYIVVNPFLMSHLVFDKDNNQVICVFYFYDVI